MLNKFRCDMEALYTTFGLSSDYEIVFTEHDNVEYFEPPQDIYKKSESYDFTSHDYYKDLVTTNFFTSSLHLDKHTVELETGSTVTAYFAVSHSIKTIFLKVTPVGEYGLIRQLYE
jgi:hypothetical protein